MVCDQCTKTQKIIYGVAGVLGLVGVVLGIVAVTAGSEGLKVDFVAENSRSFTLSVDSEHCGFSLYCEANMDCQATYDDTTIQRNGGAVNNFIKDCDMAGEDWANDHDPKLIHMGHFTHSTELGGPGGVGSYAVSSSNPLWAVDFCGQIGEAVAGIFAMLGLFVVASIVFIVSCILCCVSCCCCGAPKPAGGNVVIGAPTTVGNAQATG